MGSEKRKKQHIFLSEPYDEDVYTVKLKGVGRDVWLSHEKWFNPVVIDSKYRVLKLPIRQYVIASQMLKRGFICILKSS